MAQKLDVMKGNGGSIKVGATGTISSLMNWELNSMKCKQQISKSSKRKPPMVSVSVPSGVMTPKRPQSRISLSEASSSRGINHRNRETSWKTRRSRITNSIHLVPMLGSDDTCGDIKEKSEKKVSNIVDVVDLKCGNPNKWSNPIANRLKKLGFSKLSQSFS